MFIPILIVVVQGTSPQIARDVDSANEILSRECDLWVSVERVIVASTPHLYRFISDDNRSDNHRVSAFESELFSIGRSFGTDIVAYYVGESDPGLWGSAAHPPGQRGFWVIARLPFDFIWAHEFVHVVGENGHVPDPTNLLFPFPQITHTPPTLTEAQRDRILEDRAVLSVPDSVFSTGR